MKNNTISLLLAGSLICLTGCSSLTNGTADAQKVQNFLTNVLPPGFSGDVSVSHVNPYFNFGISAKNVHQDSNGKWTWSELHYDRADLLHTTGKIDLIPGVVLTPKTN